MLTPVKPVIRKVTQKVKKSEQPQPRVVPQRIVSAPTVPLRKANSFAHGAAASPKSRPAEVRKTTLKRKSTPTLQTFSESESDGDDDFDAVARKRAKTSESLEPNLKRDIRDTDEIKEGAVALPFIHGADLTTGVHVKDYKNPFEGIEVIQTVALRYPSKSVKERFELVLPRESDGYHAIDDIINTVEQICKNHFPEPETEELLNDSTGYVRRLKRAVSQKSPTDFAHVIDEFNTHMAVKVKNGDVARHLGTMHAIPLPLVERILSQVYARTVSPRVSTLRAYENGTDNVYGELLPRFVHEIFRETRLDSSQVFVDLGSGVGNVVLQAALEVGCESWGIEMMPNPCLVANLQAKELPARAKLWGLSIGKMQVIQGNFLSTPEIDDVLRRADVILINNQAFTADLNDKLVLKFLDLKQGAKIVSLKSFAMGGGFKMTARNSGDPRHLLNVEKKEYHSGCVSWTDVGGNYFIATKDSTRLEEFLKAQQRGGR